MATHASRDTTTGLEFEERVKPILPDGWINLKQQKVSFYKFMKQHGADKDTVWSKNLLPDEAFLNPTEHKLVIYEKKTQKTEGSADEKLQACDFKRKQYQRLVDLLEEGYQAYFIFILDSAWFRHPKYRDVLAYVKSCENCDYYFDDEEIIIP